MARIVSEHPEFTGKDDYRRWSRSTRSKAERLGLDFDADAGGYTGHRKYMLRKGRRTISATLSRREIELEMEAYEENERER